MLKTRTVLDRVAGPPIIGSTFRFGSSLSVSPTKNKDDKYNNNNNNAKNNHNNDHDLEHDDGGVDELVHTLDADLDWNDRIRLQNQWTLTQKGWKVKVEWRNKTSMSYGVGLFALQDISKGSLLRVGKIGVNLQPFTCIADIEAFCQGGRGRMGDKTRPPQQNQQDYQARLLYVKDYLWGFNRYHADEQGYDLLLKDDDHNNNKSDKDPKEEEHDTRFFGMWIPGNGLNHSPQPNTVYKWRADNVIHLVALKDIAKDEQLLDDYRRHGQAPVWLLEFAQQHEVSLNFAGCNEFVV